MSASWLVGVDIGGTFTDVVAVGGPDNRLRHLKVPSSRAEPASSVLAGLHALSDEFGVPLNEVRLLLHGTTLATNAIIERRLAKTALITTEGFRDVLEIARHWRTELYDPFIEAPVPLVPRELRYEVPERVGVRDADFVALDAAAAADLANTIHENGVESVAVVFLHSYRDPTNERAMTAILRERNGWFVCASSELSRELREYERTSTTTLNASLMPLIDEYIVKLESGLREVAEHAALFVMQSNGGALTPRAARARPVTLALSGPVGGVVACVDLARALERPNVIGFDMGGTSTDVSIISDYEARSTTELSIGDLPIRIPSIEVHSIGAGGGSIASLDAAGALRVGPESAGSDPGPAAYGRGGLEPTVTDCQLVLDRLTETFSLAGRLSLQGDSAREVVRGRLAEPLSMELDAAAAGVIEVANAAMERATRVALRERGDDPRDYALIAFGGAGPLHAAEVARRLGMRTVIVPAHPGTLSALGFLGSDVRLDYSFSDVRASDDPALASAMNTALEMLEEEARVEFAADGGIAGAEVAFERSCEVRYVGQAYEVAVGLGAGPLDQAAVDALLDRFHQLHERSYGFSSPDDPCEVVTVRVAARAELERRATEQKPTADGGAEPVGERLVYDLERGRVPTPVYDRDTLAVGARLAGPAVVHQLDTTTLIPSFATAEVDDLGNLILDIEVGSS